MGVWARWKFDCKPPLSAARDVLSDWASWVWVNGGSFDEFSAIVADIFAGGPRFWELVELHDLTSFFLLEEPTWEVVPSPPHAAENMWTAMHAKSDGPVAEARRAWAAINQIKTQATKRTLSANLGAEPPVDYLQASRATLDVLRANATAPTAPPMPMPPPAAPASSAPPPAAPSNPFEDDAPAARASRPSDSVFGDNDDDEEW